MLYDEDGESTLTYRRRNSQPAARARKKRNGPAYAARARPALTRKALLALMIRRSIREGEKIPHPVSVGVARENQWDGKWFDVTLTSDGETISIASFRRVGDARAYRKRIVEALRIPGIDSYARARRAFTRRRVMAMERARDPARRS